MLKLNPLFCKACVVWSLKDFNIVWILISFKAYCKISRLVISFWLIRKAHKCWFSFIKVYSCFCNLTNIILIFLVNLHLAHAINILIGATIYPFMFLSIMNHNILHRLLKRHFGQHDEILRVWWKELDIKRQIGRHVKLNSIFFNK